MFTIAAGHPGNPACSTTQRWAINTGNTSGHVLLAVVLEADALQKSLTVMGTGVCDVWGDSDTVSYVILN